MDDDDGGSNLVGGTDGARAVVVGYDLCCFYWLLRPSADRVVVVAPPGPRKT